MLQGETYQVIISKNIEPKPQMPLVHEAVFYSQI